MKWLVICLMCFWGNLSNAKLGGEEGNGGDMCEDRIKEIRDDLKTWIIKDGSRGLKLPADVSLASYNSKMLNVISRAKISCGADPIFIGRAEKTCKNFIDSNGQESIQCNFDRVLKTPESDQYVLIHHEYAGLAGFEVNNEEDSNYGISNQISGFLEDQVIKRLVVRPVEAGGLCDESNPIDPVTLFHNGQTKVLIQPTVAAWESRSCNDMTGCTDWKPNGNGFAGVRYSGSAELKVNPRLGNFRLDFIGEVRMHERVAVFRCNVDRQGSIDCENKLYLGGYEFGEYIKMSGELRGGCMYIKGASIVDGIKNDGAHEEYRVTMTAHF
jgi:hypothetical protein